MAWSASYLHEKINSLVASKVIDHMAVQELCLLCWHLMIHIYTCKYIYTYIILYTHYIYIIYGKMARSDDDDYDV